MRLLAKDSDHIIDILLISKMQDHDFIYGSSDLNVIFIVKNDVFPRDFLHEIRKSLLGIWPANIFVDIENLKVFKEIELQTPIIRSILVARYVQDDVTWESILGKENFYFRLKEQDHYSIQQTYIKKIEQYLFNPKRNLLINRHWIRSFGKNIYFSIKGMIRYNLVQSEVIPAWEKLAKRLIRFTFLSRHKYLRTRNLSFKMLDFEKVSTESDPDFSEQYSENLMNFARTLIQHPIVEDIIFNPALIQLGHEMIKGKIFIDIVLGQSQTAFTNDKFIHLQAFINDFQESYDENEPTYVFRFTTYGVLKLKAEHVLQSYPLEDFYRQGQSYSLKNIKYSFEPNAKQIERACIYYLLHEFMRFRTLEQKNKLIGSRFIKSLNIIYRYQLLLNYLRGQEFAVSHSYKSILEELTPQLSHIKPYDEVDRELWNLIRAQMLYILKRIRDELAKKNPSLRNLQF